jgi:hypothetical protein
MSAAFQPDAFQPNAFQIGRAAGAAPAVTSAGGLHHIWHGMGDPGVSAVPQTLHTIEQGISA